MSTDTTVKNANTAKRGRKPGQLVWTFEKVMARISADTLIDRAKLEWLNKTYGPELTPIQIMILSDHSKVKEYWTESEDFKAALSKVEEIKAEAEAIKAQAAIKAATQTATAETLLAALTPDQIAAIVAAATAVK